MSTTTPDVSGVFAKETAEERYTRYFYDELALHPDVPPSRTVISKRMGWKSSNHSGKMPAIRRDLLEKNGFIMVKGRWHKGHAVEEHGAFHVDQRVLLGQALPDWKGGGIEWLTVTITAMFLTVDGRCGIDVRRGGVHSNGNLWSRISSHHAHELLLPPDLADPDSVEEFLAR